MYLYPIAAIFAFDLWDLAAAQNDCRPKDCYDLKCYRVSEAKDGPHTIYPDTPDLTTLNVSCDQETDGGGWIMYQRRLDGTVNFTRTFEEYKRHFGQNGDNMTELWLGNENVHQVLKSYGTTECELRIEVDAWDEETCWLVASNFRMGHEYRKYTLNWDKVVGSHPDLESNWDFHKLLSFRTIDDQNKDCVSEYRGGWWYYAPDACVKVYLNGRYVNEEVVTWDSIMVFNFRQSLSLKRSRMMFRPTNGSRPCNNPCKNGGTCEHVADPIGHHCACTPEWCGATCDVMNPCSNGGICEVDQLSMGGYLTHCACTAEWGGVTCTVANPCKNDGNCEAVEDPLEHHCRPKDCYDLKCYRVSIAKDGPHTIYPDTPDLTTLQVSCDQETDGGGWIMYQRRLDGTVNFTRTFEEYKRHFGQNGDNMTELWLGNENVYQLLQSYGTTECELRIEVDAWDDETCWLLASNFRMNNESSKYTVDWDMVIGSHPYLDLNWDFHKLLAFRTIEDENEDCVREYRGGWWYNAQGACVKVYLNGRYVNEEVVTWDSIMVFNFRQSLSMKRSRMMLRPTNDSRQCNNPCKNGGTCEHVADPIGHHCACTPEWCGATCDVTSPCHNGGICEAVQQPMGYRTYCACTPEWCGLTCDVMNPCINGGICEAEDYSMGGYRTYCACPAEWCGVRCEVKSPCMNGGTCEAYAMTCKCLAGFTGQTCEDVIREYTIGADKTSEDAIREDVIREDVIREDATREDVTRGDTVREGVIREGTTGDDTNRDDKGQIVEAFGHSSGSFDTNNSGVIVALVILLRRLFGFFGC